MREQDAKRIFEALLQGNNPKTGEPITDHPVLQDADVLRALLIGLDALRLVTGRKARKALKPAKAGQPWTDEEDAALAAEFKRGQSTEKIAETHHRTIAGIDLRLEKLGLVTGSRRTGSRPRRPRQG